MVVRQVSGYGSLLASTASSPPPTTWTRKATSSWGSTSSSMARRRKSPTQTPWSTSTRVWGRPTLGQPWGEGRCPAEPSCTEERAEDEQHHCMEAGFSWNMSVIMAPKGPIGDTRARASNRSKWMRRWHIVKLEHTTLDNISPQILTKPPHHC